MLFQYYFIKSQLSGLVLDVESSITTPGALVSTWVKNGTDAQLWYDDQSTGTIRNRLNGFCMDIQGYFGQRHSIYCVFLLRGSTCANVNDDKVNIIT